MATSQQRKPAPAPAKTANKPQAPAQAAQRPATPPAARGAQQTPPPAQPQRPSTAVAAPRQASVAAGAADVPDYIRQDAARGSENVGTNDIVIPRIELVQALSKCLKEGAAEYIEGAKPGHLYNSVTRTLYGPSIEVCPVFFKKQYLCWQELDKGGGFAGAYDTMAEAEEQIARQENPENWEAVETHQQIVLIVNRETGEASEAVMSCAKTKQKVSRRWNSLIRTMGFDRFSRTYEIFGVDETNSNNQDYKNIEVRLIGFAPMEVYRRAEDLYKKIASGELKYRVDDSYDGIDPDAREPIEGSVADSGGTPEY